MAISTRKALVLLLVLAMACTVLSAKPLSNRAVSEGRTEVNVSCLIQRESEDHIIISDVTITINVFNSNFQPANRAAPEVVARGAPGDEIRSVRSPYPSLAIYA